MDKFSPHQTEGVHMNDIPVFEGLITLNIVLCDIDIVEENVIGEVARQKLQKCRKSELVLRKKNHIFYVIKIYALFQPFC